jgi:fibronectin-binding autotransporter adhesin
VQVPASALAGTAGLTKLGAGTLTLNNFSQNNFSGGVRVNQGTLALNLANLATPTNLINSGNTLTLSGSTLTVTGKTSAVASQTFASTSFNSGTSTIRALNTGTSTSINLGTLSINEPGAVVFLNGTGGFGATASTTERIFVSGTTNAWVAPWAFTGNTDNGTVRWAYLDATSAGQVRQQAGDSAGTNMASVTGATRVYTVTGTQTLGAGATALGIQANGASTYNLGNFNIVTGGLLQLASQLLTVQTSGAGQLRGDANGNLITGGHLSGTMTISAPIANGAVATNLTHIGSSTLNLSGTNLYTGQTTLNGGNLVITSTGTINTSSGIRINGGRFVQSNTASAVSPVVSLAGGTIDGTGTINTVNVSDLAANKITNGNGGTGALTIGNLTFSGDAAIDIRTAGSAGLNVSGTLATTPANGQVLVNVVANPLWVTGNTYNLISYGTLGGALIDFTKGSISGLGARQSADLMLSGSNIALSISGESALWTGAASGAWTTNAVGTPFNWKTQAGNADTEFLANDDVVFDDTGATTAVDITTASVSTNSVIFDNSNKNYTVSSTGGFGIASGTLTKNGSGTLSLTTTNNYTGATAINAGTLQISGGNAIANTGLVTLADAAGATFQVVGSETIGALGGGGATGGNVTIDAGQTLTLASGTQTHSGAINGAGVLTSSGAVQTLNGGISTSGGVNLGSGRLFLGGNNSYTGQTRSVPGLASSSPPTTRWERSAQAMRRSSAEPEMPRSAARSALSGNINYTAAEKIIGAGVGNTSANGEFAAVQRGMVQSVSGNNTFAGDD